jgi:hydrogenase/urease accessory protein HupE
VASRRVSVAKAALWRCRVPIISALLVFLGLCLMLKGDWDGIPWVLTLAASGLLSGPVFGHEALGIEYLIGTVVSLFAMAAHPLRPGRVTAVASAVATAMWLLIGISSHL